MRGRTILLGIGLACGLFPVRIGSAQEERGRSPLKVIFYSDMFSTLNRDDGVASVKAWIESISRQRRIPVLPVVETYETIAELRDAVRSGSGDLFIMSSLQYLELGIDHSRLDGLFLPRKGSAAAERYVLVTRSDRRVAFAELRGTRILFLKTACTDLGRLWLTTRLRDEGVGPLEGFFAAATDVSRASAAVLPVFFEQAEACVVDATSFDLMKELNPQLGTALEIRAESPPLVESVLCLRRGYQEYRNDVITGLAELDQEPAGRQLLTVFRISGLAPFADSALATLQELRDRLPLADEVASQ